LKELPALSREPRPRRNIDLGEPSAFIRSVPRLDLTSPISKF
jgi:hypothetical protein